MGLGIISTFNHVVASLPGLQRAWTRVKSNQDRFEDIYRRGAWGSTESGSGVGSELAATEALRSYLPDLFERRGIKRVLDAPCGDWNWMRRVDLTGIDDYVGVDIVPSVIERNERTYSRAGVAFKLADLTIEPLPTADLIICRDCWIHLSYADIASMLENFRASGATWLLTTNAPHHPWNTNKITGQGCRHINLQLAPFNFPPPVESRKDHYDEVPVAISLWRIADIPAVAI